VVGNHLLMHTILLPAAHIASHLRTQHGLLTRHVPCAASPWHAASQQAGGRLLQCTVPHNGLN
jgi:hypothetical protein